MALPFVTKTQVDNLIAEHGQGPGPGPTPTVDTLYQHKVKLASEVEIEGMSLKFWICVDFLSTLNTPITTISSLVSNKNIIIGKGVGGAMLYGYPEMPEMYISAIGGLVKDIEGTSLSDFKLTLHSLGSDVLYPNESAPVSPTAIMTDEVIEL